MLLINLSISDYYINLNIRKLKGIRMEVIYRGMKIIIECPDCGSGNEMSWQPLIREFWCSRCDYLMDWDDVKARGNYRQVDDPENVVEI